MPPGVIFFFCRLAVGAAVVVLISQLGSCSRRAARLLRDREVVQPTQSRSRLVRPYRGLASVIFRLQIFRCRRLVRPARGEMSVTEVLKIYRYSSLVQEARGVASRQ